MNVSSLLKNPIFVGRDGMVIRRNIGAIHIYSQFVASCVYSRLNVVRKMNSYVEMTCQT